MEFLSSEHNFLGITEPELHDWNSSKVVIQQVPYEHTSSYIEGSAKGPVKPTKILVLPQLLHWISMAKWMQMPLL